MWYPSIFIPVYHRFSADQPDRHTVRLSDFRSQLHQLLDRGFRFLSFEDLAHLPDVGLWGRRNVIVTIDDGHQSVLDAFEILADLRLPATLFFPIGLAGMYIDADRTKPLLRAADLRALWRQGFNLGLHGFDHRSYRTLDGNQIAADMVRSIQRFESHGLQWSPVLAFPYGQRPSEPAWRHFLSACSLYGIRHACRVKNRRTRWPLQHPYEITRTNIHGEESSLVFRLKSDLGWIRPL